jgi:hypothetical protein
MNKVLFPNGGRPLYGDDFRYMDAAFRDSINALLKGFADVNGNLIINGCKIIGGYISEGWVLLNNEAMFMPQQTYTAGQTHGIVSDITFDPAGMRILANTQQADCFERRQAKTVNNSVVFTVESGLRLEESIAAMVIVPQYSALVGSNLFSTDPIIGANISIVNNRKHLNGKLINSTTSPGPVASGSWQTVAILPNTYAPNREYYFKAAAADVYDSFHTLNVPIRLRPAPHDDIQAWYGSTVIKNIYLDGITWE